jgi:methylated-DNA-[protein]-cysteine S-methyltransferase
MDKAALLSPIGPIEITLDMGALVGLHFVDECSAPDRDPLGVVDALESYFAGDLHALEHVPVRFEQATPFQLRVWTALRYIPVGTTISYAQLAADVGRPHAFRAVGAANGRNPVALVVPCHRVIASDGTLGGYGGGIERKRWLLAHEARVNTPDRLDLVM